MPALPSPFASLSAPAGAAPPTSRRGRATGVQRLVRFAVVALFALFGAQQAAAAELDVQITTVTPQPVLSGLPTQFRITYSCLGVTGTCDNAEVRVARPTSTHPQAPTLSTSLADLLPSTHVRPSGQNVAAGGVAVFPFISPLPAGTTGDLFVSWTAPNLTTPDGTVFSTSATITATGLTTKTATASTEYDATPVISIRKALSVSPALLDRDTVYYLEPCSANFSPPNGTLNLTNLVLTDVLPVGAQYVSAAGPSGTTTSYDAATRTVTWTHPAGLPRTFCSSVSPSNFRYSVAVRYDSSTTPVTSTVTNNAAVTGDWYGDSTRQLSATTSLAHGFTAPATGATFVKYINGNFSYTSTRGANNLYWLLRATNTGNVELDSIEFTDPLPLADAQGDAAWITSRISVPANATLRYTTSTGRTGTQAGPASGGDITVASLALDPGEYLTRVVVTVTGPIAPAAVVGVVIYGTAPVGYDPISETNCLTGTFTRGGTTSSPSGQACAVLNLVDPFPSPYVGKSATTTGGVLLPGQQVRWTVSAGDYGNGLMGYRPDVFDLLPASLSYVPGSITYNGALGGALPTFTVTSNYAGTGRTLLRWTWPAGAEFPDRDVFQSQTLLSFATTIAPGTAAGPLSNTVHITDADANLASRNFPNFNGSTDSNDLDGDGNRTELFGTGSGQVTVGPTGAFDVVKKVKGSLDTAYSSEPTYGETADGGVIDYQINLLNSGNVPMNGLVLYDILPHVGDTGVAQALGTTPRLSEWTPTFTGGVVAPSYVTTYYSTSTNPCRPEVYAGGPAGCVNDWTATAPTDLTTVKALKFVVAHTFAPAESQQISFKATAPPTLLIGKVAWNSVAYRVTRSDGLGSLLVSEPNKVGIAKPGASLGDFVWLDTNGNGVQDSGEAPVVGATLNLYDEAGALVATRVTDSDGKYLFQLLEPGAKYTVKLNKASDFAAGGVLATAVPTTTGAGAAGTDSNGTAESATAITSGLVTAVGADETDTTVDFGILKFDRAVLKTVDKTTAKPGDLLTYTVTVRNNGPTMSPAADLTDVIPTNLTFVDNGGDASCTNFTGCDIPALQPGASKVFIFTGTVKTVPTGTSIANTATVPTDPITTNNSATATTTITYRELGDKVFADRDNDGVQDSGEPGIAGVTVSVFDSTGTKVGASVVTDANGLYRFTNLDPGTYTIKLDKPEDYLVGGPLFGLTLSPKDAASPATDLTDSDAALVSGVATITGTTAGIGGSSAATSFDFGFWGFDLSTTKTVDKATAKPGDTLVYTITVKNEGPGTSVAGELSDTLPAGVTLVSIAPVTALPAGHTCATLAACAIQPLASGATQAYRVTVTVNSPIAVDSVLTNTATATATGDFKADNNSATATTTVKYAGLGDVVWFDTDNDGIQDAGEPGIDGVQVSVFSTGGTLLGRTTTGDDPATAALEHGWWQVNFLDPATNVVVRFDRASDYAFGGPLYRYLVTNPTQGANPLADSNAAMVSSRVEISARTPASGIDASFDAGMWSFDLADLKVVDQQTAQLGDLLTYTIRVTNNGPGVSAQGVLTETLPAGLTLVSFGPDALDPLPAGLACSLAARTCDIPRMVSGESQTYKVTARIATSGISAGTVLTNTAAIAAPNDTDPTNNSAQASTTIQYGSVGDLVWDDRNHDGLQTAGEPGIGGVIVYLLDAAGNRVPGAVATTTSAGAYRFDNVEPGTYSVEFDRSTLPIGFLPTIQSGTNTTNGSDASPTTGKTATFTVASAQDVTSIDFGAWRPVAIGDTIWFDTDNDGVQDAAELGIDGVQVSLFGPGGVAAGTFVSGDNPATPALEHGWYGFEGLFPATAYTIKLDRAADFAAGGPLYRYTLTVPNVGADTADSDATMVAGVPTITATTPTSGTLATFDAGFWSSDLSDLKVADRASARLGDRITYTITVTNNGPGWNAQGTLTETLPTGTTLVSFGAAADQPLPTGLSCTGLVCAVPRMAPGESQRYTAVVTVNDGVASGTVLTNTATVAAPNDAISTNNVATAQTTVEYASLGGTVWNDVNHDGLQGEANLGGIAVMLVDADGNPVPGKSATTNSDGEYLFENLLPGVYGVRFDLPTLPEGMLVTTRSATNTADGSDASPTTGRTATVTLAAGDDDRSLDMGAWIPATLGGRIWDDLDHDGIQEAGEPSTAGVTVTLRDASGTPMPGASAVTDANGEYLFEDLTPGDYSIAIDPAALPASYLVTLQSATNTADGSDADPASGATRSVTLAAGGDDRSLDVGIWRPVSLGGTVWEDADDDGVRATGERLLGGVRVYLLDATGNRVPGAVATTSALGTYQFDGLTPGSYSVEFDAATLTGGLKPTSRAASDETRDSDANATTGRTTPVTLRAGDPIAQLDLGAVRPAALQGRVWFDADHDGIQDGAEKGIAGVQVTLYDATGKTKVASTTTRADGSYSFGGLTPGTGYQVRLDRLTDAAKDGPLGGLFLTLFAQGFDEELDSNGRLRGGAVTITGVATELPGSTTRGFDVGYWKEVSVGDLVYEDLNGNGKADAGEPGVGGVTVNVYADGKLVATTVTTSTGRFDIGGLPSGPTYTAEAIVPATFGGGTRRDVAAFAPDATHGVATIPLVRVKAEAAPASVSPAPEAKGVARLTITKVGPKRAKVGDVITYTITVRNTGTAAATNVVVTDQVPRGLTVAGAISNAARANGALRWQLGTLAPKAVRRIAVRFTVRRGSTSAVNVATAVAANASSVTGRAKTAILAARPAVSPAVTG